MFSMIKSRELDEVQAPVYCINRRHYGEDVKFYHNNNNDTNHILYRGISGIYI